MKAAVIGTFDGVHRGHIHLLNELKRHAAARGLQPLALTFDRHPLSLVDPSGVPEPLSSPDERVNLIRAQGVECEILPFTPQLRQMTATGFLAMLRQNYGVNLFIFGFNNRIGSDRIDATSALIPEIEAATGVSILCATALQGANVSPSAIRRALADGDVKGAAEMLGRPYSISGEVVAGRRLGRTIGFPTANVSLQRTRVLPAPGVYAGQTLGHKAVINIGRCPTVTGCNDAPLTIEVHIIGFSGDIYGHILNVEFLRRLRTEKRFASLDELKEAIAADVARASHL